MINACLVEVAADQTKVFLSIASLSLAFITILALKRLTLSNKGKVSLMYAHLSSLLFPFSLFTTNMACGLMCLPCFESPASLVILSLPTTLLLSALAGFVVIPGYFLLSSRTFSMKNTRLNSFLEMWSKRLSIKPPALYILKTVKPVAFSFRSFTSAVFLSVGLLDLLNWKEKEAVMLHELSHVKEKSSVFKLSASLMKFSPFSLLKSFSWELDADERMSDDFVVSVQGTEKHLLRAKKKIEEFERSGSGAAI